VGSVVDLDGVADLTAYGAAVAKSVSPQPWSGWPPPRLAPLGAGMLNSIGIQNPGIDRWVEEMKEVIPRLPVPVWGSAVGRRPDEFGTVAKGLEQAGVAALEVNLSCPNLEGEMFALDPRAAAEVVAEAKASTALPVGAKLSPNATDIVSVAGAVISAGADFLVLTNTISGAGVDLETRRPLLNRPVGGYSGPPLKPIALRCVLEVHQRFPAAPIVGCGGVATGRDVAEYLLCGASAVALGSVHFAEPRAGRRILSELERLLVRLEISRVEDLVGELR
jgi:dihydroorotate dehydrogenase (NAD+) catalytic subunit